VEEARFGLWPGSPGKKTLVGATERRCQEVGRKI
jgi:hypothetical protein